MKNTVAVNLFNARVQTVGRPGSSLTFNASGTKCAMTAGIGPAANAMPNVGPTINNAMRNAKNQKVVRVQHVVRWMTTERGLFGETRTDSINIGAPHVIDHGPENINSPDRSLYMSAMGCLAENSASKDYNCSWISGDAIFVVRAALGPAMVAASNSSSLKRPDILGIQPLGTLALGPINWNKQNQFLRGLVESAPSRVLFGKSNLPICGPSRHPLPCPVRLGRTTRMYC